MDESCEQIELSARASLVAVGVWFQQLYFRRRERQRRQMAVIGERREARIGDEHYIREGLVTPARLRLHRPRRATRAPMALLGHARISRRRK
jgi:hypothetical protein